MSATIVGVCCCWCCCWTVRPWFRPDKHIALHCCSSKWFCRYHKCHMPHPERCAKNGEGVSWFLILRCKRKRVGRRQKSRKGHNRIQTHKKCSIRIREAVTACPSAYVRRPERFCLSYAIDTAVGAETHCCQTGICCPERGTRQLTKWS